MANIFDSLPKKVALAILLLKALDVKETLTLTQKILYLWREFMVKIDIKPKIESYKVSFYYKDTYLNGVVISDLKDLVKVIEQIKDSRS